MTSTVSAQQPQKAISAPSKSGRALFISPIATREKNGMMQRQHQTLAMLCDIYHGQVDVVSLGAPPFAMQEWLDKAGLPARVAHGSYAQLAYWNTTLWYGGGVILCNKLKLFDRFRFPLRTPLPRAWRDRYQLVFCYYPWGHQLLKLDHAGTKVIVDLGDVMADRHERIGTRRWISLRAEDEREILQSPSRCIAISEEDAKEFERLYGVRLPVVPFIPPDWVELSALAEGESPRRVGYLGAPSYQNEEVMRMLAQAEFLDYLAAAGIDLLVAGGICETAPESTLQQLERGGARVLGRIPSVLDFYGQISTVVNPVGPSTGTKIKSIEALTAGRSLITTQWGADGTLTDAFASQIRYVDWPVQPRALGQLAVELVDNRRQPGVAAIRRYVNQTTEALMAAIAR